MARLRAPVINCGGTKESVRLWMRETDNTPLSSVPLGAGHLERTDDGIAQRGHKTMYGVASLLRHFRVLLRRFHRYIFYASVPRRLTTIPVWPVPYATDLLTLGHTLTALLINVA